MRQSCGTNQVTEYSFFCDYVGVNEVAILTSVQSRFGTHVSFANHLSTI